MSDSVALDVELLPHDSDDAARAQQLSSEQHQDQDQDWTADDLRDAVKRSWWHEGGPRCALFVCLHLAAMGFLLAEVVHLGRVIDSALSGHTEVADAALQVARQAQPRLIFAGCALLQTLQVAVKVGRYTHAFAECYRCFSGGCALGVLGGGASLVCVLALLQLLSLHLQLTQTAFAWYHALMYAFCGSLLVYEFVALLSCALFICSRAVHQPPHEYALPAQQQQQPEPRPADEEMRRQVAVELATHARLHGQRAEGRHEVARGVVERKMRERGDLVQLLSCAEPAGSDSCTICLDDLHVAGLQACRVTQCGHAFHLACLAQWFAQRLSCPQCRAAVALFQSQRAEPTGVP